MSDDPARVVIFDTTLRDGEQAPGFTMDVPAKVEMARALDALGVDIIEAGFPIASPADAEAVSEVSKHVRRPVIAALARCRTEDIQEAARALVSAERPRIHTFIATSDLHLNRKLRMTREACLEAAVAAVRLARQFTDDVEFSAEDATRSDRDFLCRVIEAVVLEGCRDRQPAGHGRLCHPRRNPKLFRGHPHARAERRPGDLQRSLPRRSGIGGRQQPGGHPGRRATGRVHDQRHRRARRERLGRGNRDGPARAERSTAVYTPTSRPRLSTKRVNCSRGLPASRFRPTRQSSVEMLSLMKPASTRMAS